MDVPMPQAAAGGAAAPVGAGAAVTCARCRVDLSRLPAAARFCPRCGAVLGAEAAGVDAADLLRRIDAGLVARDDADRDHSAMIDGYAAALFDLGQRYEASAGGQIPGEAVRCYLKAARLGNLPALGRLAAVCLARERGAQDQKHTPA